MRIHGIKATNMELTQAIEAHVRSRVDKLARLAKRATEATVAVEVGKPSDHHNKGNVFYAEFRANVDGQEFFASETADDLYKAVDMVRATIGRQLVAWKNKNKASGMRLAQRFKSMLRRG